MPMATSSDKLQNNQKLSEMLNMNGMRAYGGGSWQG